MSLFNSPLDAEKPDFMNIILRRLQNPNFVHYWINNSNYLLKRIQSIFDTRKGPFFDPSQTSCSLRNFHPQKRGTSCGIDYNVLNSTITRNNLNIPLLRGIVYEKLKQKSLKSSEGLIDSISCKSLKDVETLANHLQNSLKAPCKGYQIQQEKVFSKIGQYLDQRISQSLYQFSDCIKSVVESKEKSSLFQMNRISYLKSRRQLLFHAYSLSQHLQNLVHICLALNQVNFHSRYANLIQKWIRRFENVKRVLPFVIEELKWKPYDLSKIREDASFSSDPMKTFNTIQTLLQKRQEDFQSCAKNLVKLTQDIKSLDSVGALLNQEFPQISRETVSQKEDLLTQDFYEIDSLLKEFISNPDLQFRIQESFLLKLEKQITFCDDTIKIYFSTIKNNLQILEQQIQECLNWLNRSFATNDLMQAGIQAKIHRIRICQKQVTDFYESFSPVQEKFEQQKEQNSVNCYYALQKQSQLDAQVISSFQKWNRHHNEIGQIYFKVSEILKNIPSAQTLTSDFEYFLYQWKTTFDNHSLNYNHIQQIQNQIDTNYLLEDIQKCSQLIFDQPREVVGCYRTIICSPLSRKD